MEMMRSSASPLFTSLITVSLVSVCCAKQAEQKQRKKQDKSENGFSHLTSLKFSIRSTEIILQTMREPVSLLDREDGCSVRSAGFTMGGPLSTCCAPEKSQAAAVPLVERTKQRKIQTLSSSHKAIDDCSYVFQPPENPLNLHIVHLE